MNHNLSQAATAPVNGSEASIVAKRSPASGKIAMDMATGRESWMNKVVGVATLLALGGAWVASGMLGKSTAK